LLVLVVVASFAPHSRLFVVEECLKVIIAARIQFLRDSYDEVCSNCLPHACGVFINVEVVCSDLLLEKDGEAEEYFFLPK
jgi:hypothetical protein